MNTSSQDNNSQETTEQEKAQIKKPTLISQLKPQLPLATEESTIVLNENQQEISDTLKKIIPDDHIRIEIVSSKGALARVLEEFIPEPEIREKVGNIITRLQIAHEIEKKWKNEDHPGKSQVATLLRENLEKPLVYITTDESDRYKNEFKPKLAYEEEIKSKIQKWIEMDLKKTIAQDFAKNKDKKGIWSIIQHAFAKKEGHAKSSNAKSQFGGLYPLKHFDVNGERLTQQSAERLLNQIFDQVINHHMGTIIDKGFTTEIIGTDGIGIWLSELPLKQEEGGHSYDNKASEITTKDGYKHFIGLVDSQTYTRKK